MECYETSDLGLAAYLLMNEMKITECKRDEQTKRFIFKFDNENKIAEQFRLDYANSESRRFDSNIRMLKLMIKTSTTK